ncbi:MULTISPECIES: protein kinase domain-containing protein [unclassified Streptomyces]|uniref:protein kinase domain-containing protein n=1 Tax=unclassified Streptomyces TaxID=2593676 RepID=UPI0009388F2F|nr:protein kinase [Streptomyces sp. CB01883]
MAGRREKPIGRGGGPIKEFAEGLRALRNEAGLSYAAMEKRVPFSRATLNEAASGRKLPAKELALAYVQACGADERTLGEWAQRWEAARAEVDRLEKEKTQAAQPGTGDGGTGAALGTRQESVRQPGPHDPRQIGGFRVLGFLGSGAMGRVYLGESTGGRRVAIKVIDGARAGDAEFRARFRHEIDAARRVHGMFTAAVVAADPDAAEPWMATEYVAGPPLQEVVASQGPLKVETAIKLAAGVAEALAAIHGAGVVHRDLKPGNVLVDRDGPKVIDFGIARTRDATALTRTQLVVGTPGYVAPERLTAGQAAPASDVFSLGALLAYAVSGQSPFGTGTTEISYRIVHAEPDLEAVPEVLRELVRWCLTKDPEGRPGPQDVVDWCRPHAGQVGPGWLPAPLDDLVRQRAEEAAAVRAPEDRPTVTEPAPHSGRVMLAVLAVVAVIAAVAGLLVWHPFAEQPFAQGPSPTLSSSGTVTTGTTGGPTSGSTAGSGGSAGATAGVTGSTTQGSGGGTSSGPTAGTTSGTSGTTQGPTGGTTSGPTGGTTGGTGERGSSSGPSGSASSGSSQGPGGGGSHDNDDDKNDKTGPSQDSSQPVLGGTGASVQPRSGTVDCSQPITFTFAASAQRTGKIEYTWFPDQFLNDRGYDQRSGSMTFTTPNSQYDTYVVHLQGTHPGDTVQGAMAVQVTSPTIDRQKVGDQFALTCA